MSVVNQLATISLSVILTGATITVAAAATDCDPEWVEESALSVVQELNIAQSTCAATTPAADCPTRYIRWDAAHPPLVDLANSDAFDGQGAQMREIVRDFVAHMHHPTRLPIRVLEQRTTETQVGNVVMFVLNDQVKAMIARGQWEAERQPLFDAFVRGEAGPYYSRTAFDAARHHAAFTYLLPDHPDQNLTLTVPAALLLSLGLPRNYFDTGLNRDRLAQGVALVRLIYALPESALGKLTQLETAQQVLFEFCQPL